MISVAWLSYTVSVEVKQARVVLVLLRDYVGDILVRGTRVLLHRFQHLAWNDFEARVFSIWTFLTKFIVIIVIRSMLWRLTPEFHTFSVLLRLCSFCFCRKDRCQSLRGGTVLSVAPAREGGVDWRHELAIAVVGLILVSHISCYTSAVDLPFFKVWINSGFLPPILISNCELDPLLIFLRSHESRFLKSLIVTTGW